MRIPALMIAATLLLAACGTSGTRTLDTSNLRMAPGDLAQTYLLTQPEVVELVGPVSSVSDVGSGEMESASPFGLWSRRTESRMFTVYGPKGDALAVLELESRNRGPWRVVDAAVYTREAYRLRGVAIPPHPEQDAIMAALVPALRGNPEVLAQTGTVTAIDAMAPRFGLPEFDDDGAAGSTPGVLAIRVVTAPPPEDSEEVEEARQKLAKEFAKRRFFTFRIKGANGMTYATASARKKGGAWVADGAFVAPPEALAGVDAADQFPEGEAFPVFRATAP